MDPRKTINLLTINALELEIYLGWPNEERLRKQMVTLDIAIRTPSTPKACTTDHLDDTVCYRYLIETLRKTLSEKKFHLIEYVTHDVHRILQSLLPPETNISVSLTKRPMINGLGSVTFQLEDAAQ